MSEDKLAIGTVCGYEVSLEGEALEVYRGMTKKEQDKFSIKILHTLFHQIRELRGKYDLSFFISKFPEGGGV